MGLFLIVSRSRYLSTRSCSSPPETGITPLISESSKAAMSSSAFFSGWEFRYSVFFSAVSYTTGSSPNRSSSLRIPLSKAFGNLFLIPADVANTATLSPSSRAGGSVNSLVIVFILKYAHPCDIFPFAVYMLVVSFRAFLLETCFLHYTS